ncbi:MAG: alanine--glyoxylate aminotransferase family protein, partial [Rhodoferax sp.]|nr:alanine--glyoxylate aminotransferase family protein [Rhodoferax sp.]
ADFMTFRIGLFGLEKLHNVDRSVAHLAAALDAMGIPAAETAQAVDAAQALAA